MCAALFLESWQIECSISHSFNAWPTPWCLLEVCANHVGRLYDARAVGSCNDSTHPVQKETFQTTGHDGPHPARDANIGRTSAIAQVGMVIVRPSCQVPLVLVPASADPPAVPLIDGHRRVAPRAGGTVRWTVRVWSIVRARKCQWLASVRGLGAAFCVPVQVQVGQRPQNPMVGGWVSMI